MRAPNLILTVVISLSLGACSSVRTVNGVEVHESQSFCERRTDTCVRTGLAAAVVAGAVVGLAIGFANKGSGNGNTSTVAATTPATPVTITTTP